MIGDPGALRGLAARVDALAGEVAERRRPLVDGQQVEWHSLAAEEFRRRLDDRAREVAVASTEVHAVADAIRRQAAQVEAELAAIAAARDFVLREVREAQEGLSGAVHAVGGWLADRWNDVTRIGEHLPDNPVSTQWRQIAESLGHR